MPATTVANVFGFWLRRPRWAIAACTALCGCPNGLTGGDDEPLVPASAVPQAPPAASGADYPPPPVVAASTTATHETTSTPEPSSSPSHTAPSPIPKDPNEADAGGIQL